MKKLIFILFIAISFAAFDSYSQTRIGIRNWVLGNVSSSGERAPFKYDANVLLDGTILYSTGNYYFVDKSGHGRNFLITGYDFPDNWTKGFPYKSAATISAPVGDAALIAADVNNFFYDSGGTPNQIPVVSFFQNVDYANRLFCKHQDQLLDVNGVETFEPRVKEIVLYANAKTGADLTKCNSYYSVPEKSSTAKWVAKTGNDTSGDGTEGNPWLTIGKAQTSGGANAVVYVKTGIYTLTASQLISAGKTIKGIGSVEIKSNYTGAGYYVNLNNTTVENIVFNADSKNAYHIYTDGVHTLNKCYFKNSTAYIMYQAGTITTSTFNNCVISSTGAGASIESLIRNLSATFTFNTSYVTAGTLNNRGIFNVANSSIILKNSRILPTTTNGACVYMSVGNCTLSYLGNKHNSKWTVINGSSSAGIGNSSIKYNTITILSGTGAYAVQYPNTSTGTDIIENNTITMPASIAHFVYSVNRSCQFNRNIVNTAHANYIVYIVPTTDGHTLQANYNKILGSANAGFLGIGGAGQVNRIDVEMIGNYQKDNVTNGQHGSQFYDCKSVVAKYNYIEGVTLGLILKSDGTITHEDNVFAYNSLKNSRFVFRSIDGALVYGNTVDIQTIDEPCAMLNQNLVHGCLNIAFKNNIFKNTNAAQVAIKSEANADTWISDRNIYDLVSNNIAAFGVTNYTLAQMQGLGYDTNSLKQSANLTTGLWPTTPISIGENLGTAYKDALEITSNFGSTTQIPSIVTSEQPTEGPWQVGAFHQ